MYFVCAALIFRAHLFLIELIKHLNTNISQKYTHTHTKPSVAREFSKMFISNYDAIEHISCANALRFMCNQEFEPRDLKNKKN